MSDHLSKADELRALADRCEREEASRNLDAAVLIACGHQAVNRGRVMGWEYRPNCVGIWQSMPSPTTSLDAAVTLIADGVEWDATTLYGVARVAVGLNLNEGPHYASHEGGLLPMALCAAALRARAAVSHPDPGAI